MKRLLLIASLLCLSVSMFSQISDDKFNEDGSRIIVSKYRGISSGFRLMVSFRLIDVIDVNDGNTYFIQLNLIGNKKEKEYAKGRRLLLKLKDDSIIELINQETIRVKDYVGYAARIKYLVKENEIDKLITGEVKKIRIENDFDYVDIEVKKNVFSKGLGKVYEAIQKEKKIEKKPNSTGLYDDF